MKQQRSIFCVHFFGLFCWIKGESLSYQNFQPHSCFFFLFCVKSIMAVFGILRKYMEDGMNEGVECCQTLSSRHSMAVVLMSPQQLWLLMEDLHKTSS